ncbi:MAG: DHH family phosphoesterase [Bacteroidota bacterium]
MKHIEDSIIQQVKKSIENIKKIVVITHFNPDGDAIGSSLALYHYLVKQQYDVSVIIPNRTPHFLHWLPGNEQIRIYDDAPDESKTLIKEAELIFFLDFNVIDRTQGMENFLKSLSTQKILIDHHPEPENFADITISSTEVSSTSELLYEFLISLGNECDMNKDIAECLYTGIMTDTGSFSYNSSSPDTYYIVSKLIEQGIDKDKIYWQVYDNYSVHRMRLLGYCLNQKLKVFPEYATAYISITKNELDQFNYEQGDSEGFVNYPLSIKGIVFSVIFIEHEEHIKISFRSKGEFYANYFARNHFNGGGHRNAAGGYSETSLEETLKKFEQELPGYKEELLKSRG